MSVTVQSLIKSIDESKQKIAVHKALVGFLKSRYLSRDGLPPQSTISYERSTVTEDVVEFCILDLERKIKQEEASLEATLQENING